MQIPTPALRARRLRRALGTAAAVTLAAGALSGAVAAPARAAGPRPHFQLPFPCGQQWQLNHWGHAPALDMVKEPDQSGTEGALLIAPADGTVNQSYRHGNAGNMIQIDHGGGWFTTYIHLQSRSVQAGAQVRQGQEIGRVGRDGATSNNHPHLHFELGVDADGDGSATWGFAGAERVTAAFDGVEYGGSGREFNNVTSRNCGGGSAPAGAVVEAVDFTGEGRDDVFANYSDGSLRLWASTGDLSGPERLFTGGRLVGTGWSTGYVPRIVAGDFTGDGKSDIAAQYADGTMRAWASTGDTSADARLFAGDGQLVGEGWTLSAVPRIA
jgi:hypothetical protein